MFLATTTAANSGVMSTGMLIMWLVIMFGMMYFLMIRPQKKEQKKLQAIRSGRLFTLQENSIKSLMGKKNAGTHPFFEYLRFLHT